MSNKTYICILRSNSGGCDEPSSPSEMEQMYTKYQEWQQKFADNIVDMGSKLGDGSVVRQDGVTDGPFIELKEIIGGYMTLTAATLDEVVTAVKASPMVANASVSIEIREILTT